jgi:hypothetical protein
MVEIANHETPPVAVLQIHYLQQIEVCPAQEVLDIYEVESAIGIRRIGRMHRSSMKLGFTKVKP